jgi:hypothetical protein
VHVSERGWPMYATAQGSGVPSVVVVSVPVLSPPGRSSWGAGQGAAGAQTHASAAGDRPERLVGG